MKRGNLINPTASLGACEIDKIERFLLTLVCGKRGWATLPQPHNYLMTENDIAIHITAGNRQTVTL